MLDEEILIPDKIDIEIETYYHNDKPTVEEEKVPEVVKLPRKEWKHVNNCKYDINAKDIVKLIWTYGMKNRWNKSFKKQFPTWHAIGSKWQGQLNKFISDIQHGVEVQCGQYCTESWGDDIVRKTNVEYKKVCQKHHKHTVQILRSILEDREKIDEKSSNKFGLL